MTEKTDPYDALLATFGALREGARYYEVLKVGDRLLLGDEERELNGPWYPVLLKNPGEVVKVADTSRFSFRRPIPRPTERILEAMLDGTGPEFPPGEQLTWWVCPWNENAQTRDKDIATGWLDAIDAQAASDKFFPVQFAKDVAALCGDKQADEAKFGLNDRLMTREERSAEIDEIITEDQRRHPEFYPPTLPAAPGEGEVPESMAIARARIAALSAERDGLKAQAEADRLRSDALQESINGAAKKVAELKARAIAAEAERDRLRDTLKRIASEYPSVSGPITCPPSPHACSKCEIQFLLDEVLGAKPGETAVATPGGDA